MKLHQLAPNSPKKDRKRKGQGRGTGNGTFAGRGSNGQNSRSGGGVRLGFEGGQTPLIKRMPKLKGFRNPNKVENQAVDLDRLEARFEEGATVDHQALVDKNIINPSKGPAKILASGEINKKLKITGINCSVTAKALIEKAGGTITE